MNGGTYTFDLLALRRSDAIPELANSSGAQSLHLGQRLARLVAEAPHGCTLQVRTRALESRIAISVEVWASGPIGEERAGLAVSEDYVRHLAEEAAGLLSEAAVPSPVQQVAEVRPSDAASQRSLWLTPRGPGIKGRLLGYVGAPLHDAGIWAVPRRADPEALARLLLANPHLTLLQTVAPLDEASMKQARDDLDRELGGSGSEHEEFLGTPVIAGAAVVATGPPWTLPLRLREHLRSWFSWVDLDEVPVRATQPGLVVPESLAAGLLRLPATTESSFPGLPVEPRVVAFEGDTAAQEGVRVGSARNVRDELCDIVLSDEVRSRHVHVIGETGSGKSTLLTAIALETAARGEGLLFLDPHGTTVERILRELDPAARERVWLIRCGDTANPVRLNPFAVSDPAERDLVIGDMTEAFQQLFDPKHEGIVGPRFQRVMRNALMSLAEVRRDRTSLLDVPRLLEDEALAQSLAARLTDPTLKAFWRNDFFGNRSSEVNEIRAWVASKFSGFTSTAAMRAILESGADSFDPELAMSDNRIVLLDLAKGQVGVTGARVLGLLYLLRFWAGALSRPAPHPYTILVDEAGSFSSVPLANILAEGRKFGLRAVIAHQFMGQLVGDLTEAVEGSVATRVIFRVGHDDAKALAVATYPEFSPLDLTGLPQFVAATRLADTGQPLRPFTLEVDHNARVQPLPDADQAIQDIRARTIADLVDPLRTEHRMEPRDLALGHPPQPRSESFLDEWLEKRKRERSTPDEAQPGDASAT
ncbi:MAG: DUF87 domain-containing protein [Candidatus Nanopelagicales bacterium]